MNTLNPMEQLYIETQGQGANIVLLHGWGLHGGIWQRVADHLSTEFCVHMPDLYGHGRSPTLSPLHLDSLVDAMQQHFPLPVHLVGWSLGGLIAQAWAARHPEHIQSLTLVCSSPRFVCDDTWQHAQTAMALGDMANALNSHFEATLKRFLMLQTLGSEHAKICLNALNTQLFAHGTPKGLMPALALLQQADARPLAQNISAPTLIISGERDALTPHAASQWLTKHIHGAQLKSFPDAAHTPFLSHEAQFITLLRDFLHAHA